MAAMQDAGEARSRLMALIYGYRSTAVLHVAAIIGLADLLHGRARDSEELARETGTHTPSLLRLLRGLAVLGVVDEVVPGRFQLSGLGEPLLTDAPQSLRGQAARFGDEDGMRTWGNLLHTIRTGATTFDHIHGM